MRNADELSMTIAPAAANARGELARRRGAGENRATSRPDGSAMAASSTVISPSPQGSVARPTGRGEVAHLVDRERPLGEHPPHDRPDLTRCPDNSDAHGATGSMPARIGWLAPAFRLWADGEPHS